MWIVKFLAFAVNIHCILLKLPLIITYELKLLLEQ